MQKSNCKSTECCRILRFMSTSDITIPFCLMGAPTVGLECVDDYTTSLTALLCMRDILNLPHQNFHQEAGARGWFCVLFALFECLLQELHISPKKWFSQFVLDTNVLILNNYMHNGDEPLY